MYEVPETLKEESENMRAEKQLRLKRCDHLN